GFFTFLPMDEVRKLGRLEGADKREAKEVLAYEVTRLAHGESEGEKARDASRSVFGGVEADQSSIPSFTVSGSQVDAGAHLVDLLAETGIATSKSQARRWIE